MSQNQLASRSEIDPGQINRYERGLSEPTATNLGKLADALDVTADFLLGRDSFDAEGIERMVITESLQLFERLELPSADQQEQLRKMAEDPRAPRTVEQWSTINHLVNVVKPQKAGPSRSPKRAPETTRPFKVVPTKS